MRIDWNAGIPTDLPGYGKVWFHPQGIVNILSLARLKETYRVTFKGENENKFVVHKKDGSKSYFQQSKRGLHYFTIHEDNIKNKK